MVTLRLVHASDDRECHGRFGLSVDRERHGPCWRALVSWAATTGREDDVRPTVDGFNDEATEVVDGARSGAFTVCVGNLPELGLSSYRRCKSPKRCVDPPRVSRSGIALSSVPTSESGTGVSACPSIVKVTVPVGVNRDPVAVTTAVNVTCWPTVDGFSDDETAVTVAGNDCDPTAVENSEVFPIESVAVAV